MNLSFTPEEEALAGSALAHAGDEDHHLARFIALGQGLQP